jgi:dihydrofolate reductase
LIDGDTATEVGELKEQSGRDLLQYGVGELTQTMLQHGLVDELRLIVFPLVSGRGLRVFETFDAISLKLLDAKACGSVLSRCTASRNADTRSDLSILFKKSLRRYTQNGGMYLAFRRFVLCAGTVSSALQLTG